MHPKVVVKGQHSVKNRNMVKGGSTPVERTAANVQADDMCQLLLAVSAMYGTTNTAPQGQMENSSYKAKKKKSCV